MCLPETDYAWAAGIIDGEGYIGMIRIRKGVNRQLNDRFQVRICVRMTCKKTISRLFEMFGGSMTYKEPRDKLKHKGSWGWYIGDLQTEKVLNKILPYMTTKLDQAKLILDYRDRCCHTSLNLRIGGAATPTYIFERRLEYFNRLADLNRKGPGIEDILSDGEVV